MPNDPKIFLDYTQEQLDQAYDQLVWAPQRDVIQVEIRKDCGQSFSTHTSYHFTGKW